MLSEKRGEWKGGGGKGGRSGENRRRDNAQRDNGRKRGEEYRDRIKASFDRSLRGIRRIHPCRKVKRYHGGKREEEKEKERRGQVEGGTSGSQKTIESDEKKTTRNARKERTKARGREGGNVARDFVGRQG